MNARVATVLALGSYESGWVSQLVQHLRRRGITALALESVGVAAFLVGSQRISAVIVHEDHAPPGWDTLRAKLATIAPGTRLIQISKVYPHSLDALVDSLGVA